MTLYGFEAPRSFPVGFAPSEEDAKLLADAMPEAYRVLGHFLIRAHPNRFGWYQLSWMCDALPSVGIVQVPFRAVTLEEILDNVGLPIPRPPLLPVEG
jgi:hypothetical protein